MKFSIAFTVMVHDQITLFETLLATIFRPHNAYCIFMDSKADPGFKTIVNLLINCYKETFKNVSHSGKDKQGNLLALFVKYFIYNFKFPAMPGPTRLLEVRRASGLGSLTRSHLNGPAPALV